MGRIKTSDIKKTARRLIKEGKEKFRPNFEENKTALKEINLRETKRIRNKIAGYITRTVKRRS